MFHHIANDSLFRYKLGDPADKATNFGPVISQASAKNITSQVEDALKKGAVDSTPANATFTNLPKTGSFVAPRLLTNVNHDMSVMKDETFGPIIPVMKVQSDDEAIKLMNDSEYGLTASIWTKDVARGEEIEAEVEAGTVFINRADCPNPVSTLINSDVEVEDKWLTFYDRILRGLDGRTPDWEAPSDLEASMPL